MNTYTARAERGDGWWAVSVDEEPGIITQVRRLDQIPEMVRDALQLFPELCEDPGHAEVTVVVADEHASRAARARELADTARAAQEEASEAMREVARSFATEGLPYRDIGTLLGVSYQRAQQLATA
ncbi:transcriptional regulator [Rhodococcus sp. IEGM 1408]|uniref:transcriptional regulator n=1 Tax=Rhodococcus sp. IEGM 1408 TaxID=3082220 RepID=UPI0029555252|nr:transcriptional regulator [Rhodococcus sp. IEGM 1408]MDV8000777.1 transcriptional regulator [Rhodococcus sp. IEGM 1408]